MTSNSITAIARDSNSWTVSDGAGSRSGPFDWLVVTSPAPQTAALTATFPELVAYCRERQMLGCFALMLGFSEPVNLQWQAALVHNADVSWISVNSSKSFRDNPVTLAVHSTNAWADAHMEDDTELVLEHMLDKGSLVAGTDMRSAAHHQVHRWRYANIARKAGPSYYLDEHTRLAACCDWCVRGRIEAAFTSANDLAGSIVDRL